MYPKPSIVPPGGFHYVEKHAGTEIKLTAESVDTLAEVIEKYRLNNGIPLGEPKADVVNYICGNWPHFCNETNRPLNEGHKPDSTAGLATRAANWMTRLWNIKAPNFVKDAEADRRAAICVECPMNKDFRAGGCSSCVQGIDRLAYLWLAKRETKANWHKIRACRATGAHLQASVFADVQPGLVPTEAAQLPANCWRLPI